MKKYRVYTAAVSYRSEYRPTAKAIGGDTPVYSRVVLADSRSAALDKCLPDLRAEFPRVQGKYLSVFVGEKHNPSAFAGRLAPIQIDTETGERRTR